MTRVEESIVVSKEWQHIDRSLLQGLIMVMGAPDVGKSSFARWLLEQLEGERAGLLVFLDGDPGQSVLGPPTTLTLAMIKAGERNLPRMGRALRWFVGSTTPRGRMISHVVGVARLVEAARSEGAGTIVHDTTGLVSPAGGGVTLKLAKLDLLRPHTVIAIQRSRELEPLLKYLRHSSRPRLIELPCSASVSRRDCSARRLHRAEQFVRYFAGADTLKFNTGQTAFISQGRVHPNQLVSLEESDGFTLALGVVVRDGRTVEIVTPLRETTRVYRLRCGDLIVDPGTGMHWFR
jgi:polynucleotide 5'-kinase involved in rRNA processing